MRRWKRRGDMVQQGRIDGHPAPVFVSTRQAIITFVVIMAVTGLLVALFSLFLR